MLAGVERGDGTARAGSTLPGTMRSVEQGWQQRLDVTWLPEHFRNRAFAILSVRCCAVQTKVNLGRRIIFR